MPKSPESDGDKRSGHQHYLVTVTYVDSETFGMVFTDFEKASRFADRQKKSPDVKSVRVNPVPTLLN